MCVCVCVCVCVCLTKYSHYLQFSQIFQILFHQIEDNFFLNSIMYKIILQPTIFEN